MKCPICNIEMISKSLKNTTIDFCESCQGIWCDKDELEKLIRLDLSFLEQSLIPKSLIKNDSVVEKEKSTLCCPTCEASLQKFNYSYDSGIFLETCKICNGVWVDDGELKDIIDYIFSSEN